MLFHIVYIIPFDGRGRGEISALLHVYSCLIHTIICQSCEYLAVSLVNLLAILINCQLLLPTAIILKSLNELYFEDLDLALLNSNRHRLELLLKPTVWS